MAHIFDDENIDYAEEYPDYVFKKPKMNMVRGIGSMHSRFHVENAQLNSSEYDIDIGISKESCELVLDDDGWNDMQRHINSGKPRAWRRPRGIERLLEEFDIEEFIEDLEDEDE